MKIKLICVACFALFLSSCTTQQSALYSWKNYEKTSYNYYKKQTPESTEALLNTYAILIAKQDQGTRKVVPPGTYAEYGFLLAQTGKKEEGISMMKKEIEVYPESKVFIERIIKMLEK
ncbi:hypothetical protein SAMN05444405_105174 [Bacteroides luti]|jgi:hypothetical protein|uniref:DUF4810 domain-containing protein n=1 Tax=Bacteroides luti TaxID=1297750 RepID=A0A1M4Z5E5_9BACE|nr:DUF4810 domain-containing protein [Bacteroides luti]SHF13205.1 hypothetical protein SAMN05444405_105174 [Bacteroides luti]